MASGRYRTEMLTRHWSHNKSGKCRAPSCPEIAGTLEHLLAVCPALAQTRERLFQMWLERSVMFPSLHATVRSVLTSNETILTQFVLEPLAFPLVLRDFKSHGEHFAQQLSFLTRTFAFYMHNQYQKLLKQLNDPKQVIDLNTNLFPISAPRCDVSPHCSPAHAMLTQEGVTATQPYRSIPDSARIQCDRDHVTTNSTTHSNLAPVVKTSAVLQPEAYANSDLFDQTSDGVNAQHGVFHIQQKLLRLSEQGELTGPEPHDVLGCGGAGVGGEVAGLGVDSEHGPYHNQSLYHPSS